MRNTKVLNIKLNVFDIVFYVACGGQFLLSTVSSSDFMVWGK